MLQRSDRPQMIPGPPDGVPAKVLYVTRPTALSEPVLPEKLPPGSYLQYEGFHHTGSVREYRFRRITRGEEPRVLLVDADLSLFAKHHVALQEGPALCMHLLLDRQDAEGAWADPPVRQLTDADMLAHLARRPAPQTKGKSALPRPAVY